MGKMTVQYFNIMKQVNEQMRSAYMKKWGKDISNDPGLNQISKSVTLLGTKELMTSEARLPPTQRGASETLNHWK